jgi:SAM-dependent methyltransferase
VPHAFTAVDEQPEPRDWIEVLDRIRAEPFYVSYKARVAELLRPRPGGRYLDVGCGTGDDSLALAARYGAAVVGVDTSEAMVGEARRRGLAEAVVADAHALPFEDASFDGASADRVLQHLEDPRAALAELVRVTRPGGRIVTADPDYDTQVVAVRDVELARRVRSWRASHIRNGTLAHRMGELFATAGLAEIAVEARALVVRDPTAVDNVMGLREWARIGLSAADADAWERELDEAAARGTFLYAVTFFLTAATRV